MSDGQIVGWAILLVAYGIYRYIKHRRREEIEAEQPRALLKSKIEDYKKLASVRSKRWKL